MYTMSGWTENETRALLQAWGAESVQQKLKTVTKNKPIYDAISRSLAEMGYTKTGAQCKTKIKNLLARYRKVKDENRKSGNGADSSFPFFDEMDSILGTRAVSEPPVLLDSGIPESVSSERNYEESGSEAANSALEESLNTAACQSSPCASNVSSNTSTSDKTEATEGSSATTTRGKIKGKRKRQDEPEKYHFLAELEEAAQRRQAESDAKHLKLMADLQNQAREQEQKHEERMMMMMMSMMQQTAAVIAGRFGPQYTPTPPAPGTLGLPVPPFSVDGMFPPFYPPSTSSSP